MKKYCVICGGKFHAKGLCQKHYLAERGKLEHVRARHKLANEKYRENNLERVRKLGRAAMRRRREANPEKVRAISAEWRQRNIEKARLINAAWAKANPEKIRIKIANRAAAKRGGGGKLSKDLTARLLLLQKNKCAICHCKFVEVKPTLDHVLPLKLGGKNEDSNIQLLCGSCNSRKCAKHPVDFMQANGFLL